ncbi:DUF721 domain-containing protein [Streptomyces sp. NPDC002573]|uniref:DUF721 domain-containing protein n=1 Tax=Streptomyces sp. NPDC002573 TaxID=3364651 RepID=UPI0036C66EE5
MSGVDLARGALRAALESARKKGNSRTVKTNPRTAGRVVRRDRRESMSLGAAIGALVTERAWELPAAGASLREQWAAVAPQLAGHVAAIGYDADFGQLTVCPKSSAWATKVRLEQARAGRARCGSSCLVPFPRPSLPTPSRRPCRRWVDLAIAEPVERHFPGMRELSGKAFPETDPVQEDAPTPIVAARVQRRRQAAATETAALRRARAEKAERQAEPRHLEQTARRTASVRGCS